MTSTPPDRRTAETGPATLFDGVTAVEHRVAVELTADHLMLAPAPSPDRPDCALAWPLAQTRLRNGGARDLLTLYCSAAPDATLIVADPGLQARLTAAVRAARRPGPGRGRGLRRAIALAVALVSLIAAGWLGTGLVIRSLPVGWGGGIADATIARIAQGHPACTATGGSAALGRLATRLAAAVDLPAPTITTVAWDTVNAFALPGGRIVLTSGLIERVSGPEALAAVLAHEIGHVAGRHALADLARSRLIEVAITAILGTRLDAGHAGSLAGHLLGQAHSRDQEREADDLAIRILNALDITPQPGANFLAGLAVGAGVPGAATLLSSHPAAADRAAKLRRLGTGRGGALSPDDWHGIQTICRATARPQQ